MHGIRRVILINNGTIEYADVDLAHPTHLTGPNNKGKTTLIRAFQFLYLDSWSEMSFSKNAQTSKSFYFSENSYILFEADTPTGIKLIGMRGLGPQRDYTHERFVVNGTYDRACFFDGDRLRDWEDISQNHLLPKVPKGQTRLILEHKELRNALIGSGDSCGVRLELVPSDNFHAFKAVFKRLIGLDEMVGHTAFAELFIDVLGPEIESKVLDLTRENEKLTEDIRKHENELQVLEENRDGARKMETEFKQLHGLLEGLPREWVMLNEAMHQGMSSLHQQQTSQEEIEERRQEQITLTKGNLATVNHEVAHMRGELGGVNHALASLDKERERFEGLPLEALRGKAADLEEALSQASTKLRILGRSEDRKAIEQNLARLEAQREHKQSLLDKPSASWSARILGDCLPEERDAILRLIHPDIVTMPEGPSGVIVKDEKALYDFISTVAGTVKGDTYEDRLVRINLKGVRPPKIGIHDVAAIEKEIEAIVADTDAQKSMLESARNREKLQSEAARLAREAESARREVFAYEAWQERENERPSLEARAADLHRRIQSKTKEVEELTQEVEDLKGLSYEHGRWMARTNGQMKDLRETKQALGTLLGDWELPELAQGAELPRIEEIPARYVEYRDKVQKAESLEGRLTDNVANLRRNLGGLVSGLRTEDLVESIAQQMDSIPDRKSVLQREKRSLVVVSGRKFTDFYQGFKSVKALAARINKALADVQVSDLRSVEIGIEPTDDARLIDEYTKLADLATLTPEEDSGNAVDQAIRRIAERKEPFRLVQLFDIRVKVIKQTGESSTYSGPDVESKGTGLTVKLIILARMLREVAKSMGKAPARLPVFIDEAQQFDDANRAAVIRAARDLGFGVISASPTPVSMEFGRIYFLDVSGGKTWITEDGPHLLIEEDGTIHGNETVEDEDAAPIG